MASLGTQPDTVILNANVITIDPGRPRAQAVAISQGRFVAVGDSELRYPDRQQRQGLGSQPEGIGGGGAEDLHHQRRVCLF